MQLTTVPQSCSRPHRHSCTTKRRTCHVCRVNIISTSFLRQMPSPRQPGSVSFAANVDSTKRLAICAKPARPSRHFALYRASKTFTALLIFDCGVKLDNVDIRSRPDDVCRAAYRSVVSSDMLDFCVRFSCCATIKCDAALDCSISCYAVLLPHVSGQGPISSMQTA